MKRANDQMRAVEVNNPLPPKKQESIHWNHYELYIYIVYIFEIEIYISYESWINTLSIDVWFVMIGQYLAEIFDINYLKI